MNPYLILVVILGFCGIGVGGFKLGVDHEKASESDKKDLVAEAVDAANQASAEAIAKLKVKNTTITNEVQHEIRTNTIYADCKLTSDGMRLTNQALHPSTTVGASDGKLPRTDTPN